MPGCKGKGVNLDVLDAAREAPGDVAAVASGREWRFAELAPRVAAVAAALRDGAGTRGDGPAARPRWLVLDAHPSLDCLVHLWGAFQAGVPVALCHPRWTAAERARAVALLPATADREARRGDGRAVGPPPAPPDDGRPLVAIFTSGSAGRPKGVVLSRAAALASAQASAHRLGWRPHDRWLLSLSPAHVGGLAIVVRCLAARKAVVLADATDAPATLAAIRSHRVTLLSLVPAQLRRLLDAASGEAPPSLRAVLVGGGPCPPSLLDEAVARRWPVLPTYGLTEAGSQVATAVPPWRPADGLFLPPLEGVAVRLVEGEVQLRGPMVCSAILAEGDAPSPFTPDGWLATGDLGRLDEGGRLEVVGRRDSVIITGGEKVVPEEVELALTELAAIEEAVVVGLEDPVWGQVVAAVVVARPGERLELAAVRSALAVRLAPFKLPRRLVAVERLPRLPSGKPDRRAAAALFDEAGTCQ